MKIQFNTDKNIEGHERLETYFAGELEKKTQLIYSFSNNKEASCSSLS
ncbi:hypothetical protein [Flavobacterium sp.]|nr:hypothetical protein [Flavobacterium sp.]